MALARKRRHHARKLPIQAIALGLIAGMSVVAGCLMVPGKSRSPRSAQEPVVRVRVLANVPQVELIVDGTPRTVVATSLRSAASIIPTTDTPITIAGRKYRGEALLVPVDGDSMDVINVLSVDEYVAGVVPREVFPSWPLETLKAQAIAARTYAIFQLRTQKDSSRSFDLHADVRSQAYGGVTDEQPGTSRAVEETRGIVLASGLKGQERIFCTYFSATCGGLTASGQDVFNDSTPTLRERVSDGCTEATRYRWPEVRLKKDELTRRFKVYGDRNKMSIANMGMLKSIEIIDRNQVGRPSRFVVTDVGGRRYPLMAEQMRNACNADGPKDVQIYSSFFTPVDGGDHIRFTDGRGWGHGVGLCQWCAAGWGKGGMKYDAILKKSYPGAVLVKAY